MLNFFRNLRQRFLSEGKLQKYMLYGAGEILLVMIGILLALQVNNWNQKRKDSREFRLILNSIERDINLDMEFLDQMHKIGAHKYQYFSTLIQNRNKEHITKDLILELGEPRIPLNNAGYITAINDNKLKLIADDELKTNIVSYYNNELKFWETQAATMANIHLLIMQQTFEKSFEITSKHRFTERVEVLLEDESFQELINSFARMTKLMRDLARDRYEKAQLILQLIKVEKEN